MVMSAVAKLRDVALHRIVRERSFPRSIRIQTDGRGGRSLSQRCGIEDRVPRSSASSCGTIARRPYAGGGRPSRCGSTPEQRPPGKLCALRSPNSIADVFPVGGDRRLACSRSTGESACPPHGMHEREQKAGRFSSRFQFAIPPPPRLYSPGIVTGSFAASLSPRRTARATAATCMTGLNGRTHRGTSAPGGEFHGRRYGLPKRDGDRVSLAASGRERRPAPAMGAGAAAAQRHRGGARIT